MVAFASALVTNTVYPLEHGAAALPAVAAPPDPVNRLPRPRSPSAIPV